MIEIRVLCDSRVKALGVIADNSISLLVNDVLLIDACSSYEKLTKNAMALGVDLSSIKYAIITSTSRHHWGGIEALRGNLETTFVPYDTSSHGKALIERLNDICTKIVMVRNERDEHIPRVGHVRLIRIGNERIGELIVLFPDVRIVIVGCGLALWLFEDRIVEFFKKLGVREFVGGLGASSVSFYQVTLLQDLLRLFSNVYPLHSVGPKLREELIRRFRNVRDVGIGSVIRIEGA